METWELSLFDSPFDKPIEDFLKSSSPWWMTGDNDPRFTISADLHDLFDKISSLDELDERVFWTHINAIRRKYKSNKDKRIRGLRAITYFYIYLIKKNPELGLFENARTLYPSLLENRAFVTEWLENNCLFMTYSPGMQYDGHEQYIFIIRGAEHLSSKLRPVDYKRVDRLGITSYFYRRCVFDYVCSNTSLDRKSVV